mgnify:CR=1 FL=1
MAYPSFKYLAFSSSEEQKTLLIIMIPPFLKRKLPYIKGRIIIIHYLFDMSNAFFNQLSGVNETYKELNRKHHNRMVLWDSVPLYDDLPNDAAEKAVLDEIARIIAKEYRRIKEEAICGSNT